MSPRALPPDASQVNSNLLATASEFRPLLGDRTVATVPAGTKTIYRLLRDATGALRTEISAGWIAEAVDKSYVKGQINDDATERTYVSFNDGSAPPRVIDATGDDRLLGVPRPSGVTATTNVVEEFSADDAIGADTSQVALIAEAFRTSFVQNYYGNSIPPSPPTPTQFGWLGHGTALTSNTLPSVSTEQWNLCVPVVGGEMHEAFAFLRDSVFGGTQITYAGTTYWAVPITVYAPLNLPDPVALSAALTAMTRPDDPAEPLFDPAEVESIVNSTQAYWNPATEPLKGAILAATAATDKIRRVIDTADTPTAYSTDSYNAAFSNFTGPSYEQAGPGFARIFYQAAQYAKTSSSVVGVSSRYWINGGSAACYANLLADVNTCITADADGFRSCNFAKLQDFLSADFTKLIEQDAADMASNKATLLSVVDYCIQPFRSFFSAANMASFGVGKKTGSERALALSAAMAEANQALTRLKNLNDMLFSQRTTAASNAYKLGARTRVMADAVVRLIESRFYVVTFVTDRGEESAPCDPSPMLEMDQNDSATVSRPTPPAGRNITHWRLYRSNSGSTAASFQFVDELPIGTASYTDTKSSSELGEPCPTIGPDGITYWLEPPTRLNDAGTISSKPKPYLRGLVGMTNGVMAGFIDNFVAFCEPYAPYAWPLQYQIAVKHPIVGLRAFGQSLFVGTLANPSIISGADSASMSEQVLDDSQACSSARSIASTGKGVLYASPDGVCFANSGGVEVITTGLFAREDWALLDPSSIVAALHESVYYFWYTGNGGGCYALDIAAKKLARVDMSAGAVFIDSLADSVFYASGTELKQAFSVGRRVATWKSPPLELPAQTPLVWAKVTGDQSENSPVTLTWVADGQERYTKVVTDNTPWRLPPGRYLEHEITLSGSARVTKVVLAGSTEELRGVS
jgi:hypothetical protein